MLPTGDPLDQKQALWLQLSNGKLSCWAWTEWLERHRITFSACCHFKV